MKLRTAPEDPPRWRTVPFRNYGDLSSGGTVNLGYKVHEHRFTYADLTIEASRQLGRMAIYQLIKVPVWVRIATAAGVGDRYRVLVLNYVNAIPPHASTQVRDDCAVYRGRLRGVRTSSLSNSYHLADRARRLRDGRGARRFASREQSSLTTARMAHGRGRPRCARATDASAAHRVPGSQSRPGRAPDGEAMSYVTSLKCRECGQEYPEEGTSP